ncbi:MAG: hypothetical protein M3070_11205 [Actinomycetota bacterium]|nr:hypothetical protein [Actinomycetota bacterium]
MDVSSRAAKRSRVRIAPPPGYGLVRRDRQIHGRAQLSLFMVNISPRIVAATADASLIVPSTCTLIEAKRLRQGSSQREQLAREYVAVIRSAGDRAPLLLLIIPYAPPVPVKGLGRMTVHEAIATSLERVLERTEARKGDLAELTERIPQTIAWVTWKQLGDAVRNARAAFVSEDVSVVRTFDRLCDLVTDSIQRHG